MGVEDIFIHNLSYHLTAINLMKGLVFMKKRRWRGLLVAGTVLAAYISIRVAATKIETSLPASGGELISQKVIILDAGHGGMDGGCSTADGVPEKGINLNIMLAVRDMLSACGYTVEVTRDTDTSIHDKGISGIAAQKSSDMDNRLALFNKYSDAICISIHQNQYITPNAKGAQMFYSDANPDSQALAQMMQTRFVRNLQPDNTREIKLCGSELFLCHFCKNPTVMIECGFLSNPEEAKLLVTDEYQKQVAFTIFSGINEFLLQD